MRARTQRTFLCEVGVPGGLEAIACHEIERRLGARVDMHYAALQSTMDGQIRFLYSGDLAALLELGTVQTAYVVCQFAVSRPRALLGDAALREMLELVGYVRGLWPRAAFTTLRLDAAGAESAVMTRLRRTLAEGSGLQETTTGGDLEVRVRRSAPETVGWDVLVRLGPRPLATRAWRVCNLPGALNAAAAHAMVLMTQPHPNDVFLNLGCGSGTLLIERLECAPAGRVIGCDSSLKALSCARRNITAAGYSEAIELFPWDVRDLPLPDRSVDAACCDLPFGHLVGSHSDNVQLYPALLREAARVSKRGAPLVLMTQEVRLLDRVLAGCTAWQTERRIAVRIQGLPRRVVLLTRR